MSKEFIAFKFTFWRNLFKREVKKKCKGIKTLQLVIAYLIGDLQDFRSFC